VTNAARAAALLAFALTGCAGGPAESPDDGGVRVLHAMPDGAIVLCENEYDYQMFSTGLIGLPMDNALSDAAEKGADAIVVVEYSIDGLRHLLRVKFIRVPK